MTHDCGRDRVLTGMAKDRGFNFMYGRMFGRDVGDESEQTELYYDEKADLWGIATGSEYAAPVAFCPWCGQQLSVKGRAER